MAEEMKFRKGMEVEVKGVEPGFQGSWYAATIFRVLRKQGRYSILYDSLVSESDELEKLKEIVDGSNIRPRPPPVETDVVFEPGDLVDAYQSEGWWEGVIKEAAGESRFVVHFPTTMDESEFEKSELRQRWGWIDGKWFAKTKEVVGQEQWQGNDVSNKDTVTINSTGSQGHDVDGEQPIDDPSLSEIHMRVESESLTASETLQPSKKLKKGGETRESQLEPKFFKPCINVSIMESKSLTALETSHCKQMKEDEETQEIQVGFGCIKCCIGVEAQTDVSVIVDECSEANISGERQELEKSHSRPEWKKRKASPGKQQTGIKPCQWGQQPETKSSNTESPTRIAEYNSLGTVMKIDFIEPKSLLNECNIVTPQLLCILDEKATLAANEELSQRKAEEPLNCKEASNQLNEGQLEQTSEQDTLLRDIEVAKQLTRGGHSSFPGSIDSKAVDVQSNESNSKEGDAILQSLRSETEESKDLQNKESHASADADDTKLSANMGLPFGRGSPVWHMVGKMEAFGLMPQYPHFHPLDHPCEEYREGMALGHMVTFANLVDNTRKSQPDDPPTVFENRLKALAELEGQGFNVKPLQARLMEMLTLKGVLEDYRKNEAKIGDKIIEKEHESALLREKIVDMDMDIIKHEKQLTLLRKKRELTLKEDEIVCDETSRLQKEQQMILGRCHDVKRDFRSLAASPW